MVKLFKFLAASFLAFYVSAPLALAANSLVFSPNSATLEIYENGEQNINYVWNIDSCPGNSIFLSDPTGAVQATLADCSGNVNAGVYTLFSGWGQSDPPNYGDWHAVVANSDEPGACSTDYESCLTDPAMVENLGVVFTMTETAPPVTGGVLSAAFFTVPTTSDITAGVGEYSLWFFGALLVFVLMLAGIVIGGMFAGKFKRAVVSSVGKVAGAPRRSGARYRYIYKGGRAAGFERY